MTQTGNDLLVMSCLYDPNSITHQEQQHQTGNEMGKIMILSPTSGGMFVYFVFEREVNNSPN
jgi:hypothetical protein